MLDLVRNPEDRFSNNTAHKMFKMPDVQMPDLLSPVVSENIDTNNICDNFQSMNTFCYFSEDSIYGIRNWNVKEVILHSSIWL